MPFLIWAHALLRQMMEDCETSHFEDIRSGIKMANYEQVV